MRLEMSQCRTQLRLGFYLRQWLCSWQGSMYHNPPRSWLLGGSANPVLTDDQGTSLLLGPHSHRRGNRLLLLGFFLITHLSECPIDASPLKHLEWLVFWIESCILEYELFSHFPGKVCIRICPSQLYTTATFSRRGWWIA